MEREMPSHHQLKLSDRHREAMRRFMKERGLKPYSWANRAGVASSAIYNFLNGTSNSLTSKTLNSLAEAARTTISEILGETDVGSNSDSASSTMLVQPTEAQRTTNSESLPKVESSSDLNRSGVHLPPSVLTDARRQAEAEGMSVDHFVTLAVAERIVRLDEFYRAREGRSGAG